ncbi:hypothetical protein GALMADRAFT_267210 [Galerina marginata CBS 339.88]|uniref:Uncharacterized protein n=1 Tax=Galerina marginata (strain CBS 339.88) TaxID=685588 RepID=A0A067TDF8_GALM3|nr:hypothetical protein GALMADRAFT_267210 [Galerina marginata CBS 339.88]
MLTVASNTEHILSSAYDLCEIGPSTKVTEREKKLEADPLAIVLSPYAVECYMCKKEVKLSTRSPFDNINWEDHRAQCLAKLGKTTTKDSSSEIVLYELESSNKEPTDHHISMEAMLHELSFTDLEINHLQTVHSPEGMEDHEDEQIYFDPSPSPLLVTGDTIGIRSNTPQQDDIFQDYLRRCHPQVSRQATRPLDNWRSWSWSQLSQPRFPLPVYDVYDHDSDDFHKVS